MCGCVSGPVGGADGFDPNGFVGGAYDPATTSRVLEFHSKTSEAGGRLVRSKEHQFLCGALVCIRSYLRSATQPCVGCRQALASPHP
jgi:hypothetical protein